MKSEIVGKTHIHIHIYKNVIMRGKHESTAEKANKKTKQKIK
jgi:hypothetical protein